MGMGGVMPIGSPVTQMPQGDPYSASIAQTLSQLMAQPTTYGAMYGNSMQPQQRGGGSGGGGGGGGSPLGMLGSIFGSGGGGANNLFGGLGPSLFGSMGGAPLQGPMASGATLDTGGLFGAGGWLGSLFGGGAAGGGAAAGGAEAVSEMAPLLMMMA